MLNEVQGRSASAPSGVIASPVLVAFLELKKAGVFDASAKGVTAVNWLEQSTSVLKGIGAAGAAILATRGIKTVIDLAKHDVTDLLGLEVKLAKAAYAVRTQVTDALVRNGISVQPELSGPGTTTLAIVVDPATGITYSS